MPKSKTKRAAGGDGGNNSPKAKKPKAAPAAAASNPMLDAFRAACESMPPDMPRLLDAKLAPERRAALWVAVGEAGEAIRQQFGWAIPDERALNAIAHFATEGGVVEVGGRG
jgi:hypothetical protein